MIRTNDSSAGSARSWRSVACSATGLGLPIGVGLLHPVVGVTVATVEMLIALTIVGTALFGSSEFSNRAFRLLRCVSNKPEPPDPQQGTPDQS